ncbi:c-type cytochrome [Variovorax sp. RA8]|uniref:c-type cytochrome n=1 Tax=Variovorax sp. (strain JCM 16519 / RA8) TaxID=662548 RepID=UPI000AFE9F40|nr:cytochrome c [Variovorax sp. RA8]VTU16312.1 Cytochrome c552 [Variovorax sp. RA8]
MQQPEQSRKSEHADPHEQYNPVPRVVLGLALALVVWAVAYILMARPDGLAGLGDQRLPNTLAQGTATLQGAAVDGRQLFVAKCQACHQANGQGLPGVFPPLAGASWVKGSVEVPVQILLHGLNGPIEVAGATYNGAMPAFGEQLNDAELAAVLSFVRGEWGNSSPTVEVEVVQSARKVSAERTEPWSSAADLEKFLASTGARP